MLTSHCADPTSIRNVVVRNRPRRLSAASAFTFSLRCSSMRPPVWPHHGGIDRRVNNLPATAPAGATSQQPYDQQQQDRSDRRVDNGPNDAGAEMNAKLRQQPASDQRADDSDQQIADQSEAGASHNLAGQPAGHDADDKNDEKTFT